MWLLQLRRPLHARSLPKAARCEAQGAALPLIPYLDVLRWVLIALALAGLIIVIYARLDDWQKGQR